MTYIKVVDSIGFTIYDSIPPSLKIEKANSNNVTILITHENKECKFRYGFVRNSKGCVFVLTNEKKYINSKGLFKDFLLLNLLIIESFANIKNEIAEKYNNQTKGLIHNLRTLNAQNIQAIFALVPQQTLTRNINEQITMVREEFRAL